MTTTVLIRNTYRDAIQSYFGTNPSAQEITDSCPNFADYGSSAIQRGGGTFMAVPASKGRDEMAFNQHLATFYGQSDLPQTMLGRNVCKYYYNPQPHDVLVALAVEDLRMMQDTNAPYLLEDVFEGMNALLPMQDALDAIQEANAQIIKEFGPDAILNKPRAALCIEDKFNEDGERIFDVEHYVEIAQAYLDMGYKELSLKSASGAIDPAFVGELTDALFERLGDRFEGPLGVHVHDTYGKAINGYVAAAHAAEKHSRQVELDALPDGLSGWVGQPGMIMLADVLEGEGFTTEINREAIEADRAAQNLLALRYGVSTVQYIPALHNLMEAGCMAGGASATLRAIPQIEDRFRDTVSVTDWNEVQKLIYTMQASTTRADLGYLTQVTPYAKITTDQAIQSIMSEATGGGKWDNLHPEAIDLLLGRFGETPKFADPALIEKAREQDIKNAKIFGRERKPEGYTRAKDRPQMMDAGREALIEAGIAEPTDRQIISAVTEKSGLAKGVARVVGIANGENNPQTPYPMPPHIEAKLSKHIVGEIGADRFQDIANKALMLNLIDDGKYPFPLGQAVEHNQLRDQLLKEIADFAHQSKIQYLETLYGQEMYGADGKLSLSANFMSGAFDVVFKSFIDAKGPGVHTHLAIAMDGLPKRPHLTLVQKSAPEEGVDESSPADSIAGGAG